MSAPSRINQQPNRRQKIKSILQQAKFLVVEYYNLTGKPLGITGELAEYEAADKLQLTLADAGTELYDASSIVDGKEIKYQIKGRAVSQARVPSIRGTDGFDIVLLVLLEKFSYDLVEIWEAKREDVLVHLDAEGSKSRNIRRSMGISQFKSISNKIWPIVPSPVGGGTGWGL